MTNNIKITKTSSPSSWQVFALMTCAALVLVLLPDLSFADDPFGKVLCTIKNWFTSGTGRAIATIAVIFLGIAAFFGKVTWGLALMFAVGIFAIFGAAEIVNAIAPGHDVGTCTGF